MEPVKPTRTTPRYPFVAPAEVIDEGAGAKMTAQVKELSLYGCYLDSASPLPTRTKVIVKIYAPEEFFEAGATVIYANQTLGMGLVFRDVKPHYQCTLRKWLNVAMQEVERRAAEERALTETREGGNPEDEPPQEPTVD
jgi:hypothetical protein